MGPQGPQGVAGPPGPATPPNAYATSKTFPFGSGGSLLTSTFSTLLTLTLPAGRFLVSAYAVVDNGDPSAGATPWCQILGPPVVTIRADLPPSSSTTLSYTTPVLMNSPGTIQVRCQQADRTATPNTKVSIAGVGITAVTVNLEQQVSP
jgi:hypothetical protein